jgi:hypothetical protein
VKENKTAMPTINWRGKKYYGISSSKYYMSSPNRNGENKGKYLHREVWKWYFGEIPKGYVVHHRDGDPLNNSIENLECLSAEEHRLKHHHRHWTVKGMTSLQNHMLARMKVGHYTCEACHTPFTRKSIGGRNFRACSKRCRDELRKG